MPYTLDQARTVLTKEVDAFVDRAGRFLTRLSRPPPLVVAATCGFGKTFITAQAITRKIKAEQARGTRIRVIWVGPTHKLNGQIAALFADQDVRVMNFEGRSPANCDDYANARAAAQLGSSVSKSVCSDCQSKAQCRYFRQHESMMQADVVCAAHNFLALPLPQEVGEFDLLVIDESPWLNMLETHSLTRHELENEVRNWPAMAGGMRDRKATDELENLRAQLSCAIDLGFTLPADLCNRAIELEERRTRDDLIRPGMTKDERDRVSSEARANRHVRAFIALWKAMAAGETGRIEVEGGGYNIHTRRIIQPDLAKLPTIFLDATPDLEVVQLFLPDCRIIKTEIEAPFERRHCIWGRFGKRHLLATPAKIEWLRELIKERAGGKRALVVTYKELCPQFEGLPNTEVAHFGGLRGLNDYKDVRYIFRIGDNQPAPWDVAVTARKLFGEEVKQENLAQRKAQVLMRDGTRQNVYALDYLNPRLRAVRRAVGCAESEQAAGRGRGILRDGLSPLDVICCTSAPTEGMIFDTFGRLDLTPWEIMASFGVGFDSMVDAKEAYGDALPSLGALKHRKAREVSSASHIFIYEMALTFEFRYQRPGNGRKPARAWCNPDLAPNLEKWLTDHFGPGVKLLPIDADEKVISVATSTTILVSAKGQYLAKRHTTSGDMIDFAQAKWFYGWHAAIPDLDALAALLLRDQINNPLSCMVRGALIDPDNREPIRRLIYDRGGEPATLVDVPRQWIALDIDEMAAPSGVAPGEIEAYGRHAIRQLPPEFHDCKCIVQPTASHGFRPGEMRLRLWFWTDRAITCAEAKRWLGTVPGIDAALFSAAQIIYTAAPLFDSGVDPLPRRLAILPGEPMVTVPSLTTETIPATGSVALADISTLESLAAEVASARKGNRHNIELVAARRTGHLVAAGEVDPSTAIQIIAEAAIAAGEEKAKAWETAKDGVNYGMREYGVLLKPDAA
jgi:hypothetical protein